MWIKPVTGLLILLFVSNSCFLEKSGDQLNSGKEIQAMGGEISFEKSEHDLGTVLQGETLGYNVEVVFNSTGRLGKQSKTVTIQTNGKLRVVKLTIRANIIKSNS